MYKNRVNTFEINLICETNSALTTFIFLVVYKLLVIILLFLYFFKFFMLRQKLRFVQLYKLSYNG